MKVYWWQQLFKHVMHQVLSQSSSRSVTQLENFFHSSFFWVLLWPFELLHQTWQMYALIQQYGMGIGEKHGWKMLSSFLCGRRGFVANTGNTMQGENRKAASLYFLAMLKKYGEPKNVLSCIQEHHSSAPNPHPFQRGGLWKNKTMFWHLGGGELRGG